MRITKKSIYAILIGIIGGKALIEFLKWRKKKKLIKNLRQKHG